MNNAVLTNSLSKDEIKQMLSEYGICSEPIACVKSPSGSHYAHLYEKGTDGMFAIENDAKLFIMPCSPVHTKFDYILQADTDGTAITRSLAAGIYGDPFLGMVAAAAGNIYVDIDTAATDVYCVGKFLGRLSYVEKEKIEQRQFDKFKNELLAFLEAAVRVLNGKTYLESIEVDLQVMNGMCGPDNENDFMKSKDSFHEFAKYSCLANGVNPFRSIQESRETLLEDLRQEIQDEEGNTSKTPDDILIGTIEKYFKDVSDMTASDWSIDGDRLVMYTGNDDVIHIPEGVRVIGTGAFASCSAKEIVCPETLAVIENRGFASASMDKIDFPSNLDEIGEEAFMGCSSIKTIIIPKGIKTIKRKAFLNCESLETVKLPDGLDEIEEEAFENCSYLTSIELPQSLNRISNYAFRYCLRLVKVDLRNENCFVCDEAFDKGVLINIGDTAIDEVIDDTNGESPFIIDGDILLKCKGKGIEITVPDGIRIIDRSACAIEVNDNFEPVEPASITIVNLPEGLQEIDKLAFEGQAALKSVRFPSSLQVIGEGAFSGCFKLEAIDLPEGLKRIEKGAFHDCGFLSVVIPDSVEYIGPDAFPDSFRPYEIEGKSGSAAEVYALKNDVFFRSNGNASSPYVPYPKQDMPDYVIADDYLKKYLGNEEEIIVPALRVIDAVAFVPGYKAGYTLKVRKLKISEGTEVINDGAFAGCECLSEIELPQSLKQIRQWAFSRCAEIKEIVLPECLNVIGEEAFAQTSIKDITIPESVERIGNNAFGESIETVHGKAGTIAERYARKNGLTFMPI